MFGVLVGVLNAAQAAMAGELTKRSGSALSAAATTTWAGIAFLLLASLYRGTLPRRPQARHLLAGLAGPVIVTGSAVAVSNIGVAATVAVSLAANVATGTLLDAATSGSARPGARQWAGTVVACGGALLLYRPGEANAVLAAFSAAVVGVALGVQPVVNARIGASLGGPLPTTLVVFAVSGALSTAALLVTDAHQVPTALSHPWLLFAGVAGALSVITATWALAKLGAGALAMLSATGNLGTGVLIDAAQGAVSATLLIAVAVVAAGVMLGWTPSKK